MIRSVLAAIIVFVAAVPSPAPGQQVPTGAPEALEQEPVETLVQEVPAGDVAPEPRRRFRFHGEIKSNARQSRLVEFQNRFPFPPGTVPANRQPVFMRTVSSGTSLEISNVALGGEGELFPGISAKLDLRLIDLYNRNPTSTDDEVVLREAWLQFGRKAEFRSPEKGSRAYLLLGKAPRFTKQTVRQLESYGLWGTASGRLEQIQIQSGGEAGRGFYWRLHLANPNPLFIRDTNALAGDHGTPDKLPGSIIAPVHDTGFPILYDTKAPALNGSGEFEYGAGAGFRLHSGARTGVDLLGWYFRRDMDDRAPVRGSFYSGDLYLLKFNNALPVTGNTKTDTGVNLEARVGAARVFGQYVHQDIAGLVRDGIELELAYRHELGGLFALGDHPVVNWIQPVVRFSSIDNQFVARAPYPAPSVMWDWRKLDVGIRIGLVRNIDLTAEFSRHDMILAAATLHPDELLVTVRAGF